MKRSCIEWWMLNQICESPLRVHQSSLSWVSVNLIQKSKPFNYGRSTLLHDPRRPVHLSMTGEKWAHLKKIYLLLVAVAKISQFVHLSTRMHELYSACMTLWPLLFIHMRDVEETDATKVWEAVRQLLFVGRPCFCWGANCFWGRWLRRERPGWYR